MLFVCIFLPYLLNIYIKFEFLVSHSKMPKVRRVMSYGICSKFHTLSSSTKILKINEDLTKLQRV